jgi:hypothetical protein
MKIILTIEGETLDGKWILLWRTVPTEFKGKEVNRMITLIQKFYNRILEKRNKA